MIEATTLQQLDSTVMQLMNQGGWVMWALLAFSVAAVAVALERTLVLKRANIQFEPFLRDLQKALLTKKSLNEALAVCTRAQGAVPRVAGAGLHRFTQSSSHLEKSLERRSLVEIRRLRRGLGLLATTAGTAPLLGFLGTVTGMMDSFDVLANFSLTNPGQVALGIKEALTTTAGGLVVAVPCQLLYSALSARLEKITNDMEAVSNFLLEAQEELG